MTSGKDDFDFDTLKSAMQAATPAPDAARRAENLRVAQENFNSLQGSLAESRQTSIRPEKRGLLNGVFQMIMTRSIAGLTATTAIVAVGLLFFTPLGQDLTRGRIAAPQAGNELIPQVPLEVGTTETATPPEADVITGTFAGNVQEPPSVPAVTETEQAAAPESDGGELADAEALMPLPAPLPTLRDQAVGRLTGNAPAADAFSGGIAQMGNGQSAAITQQGYGNTSGFASIVATDPYIAPPESGTEEFANDDDNPLRVTAEDPVSTFSIDVDTAAYSIIRSSLQRGALPPPDAVRIEEMVNYFRYDYAAPTEDDISPFRPTVNVFETPWNPDTRLVHIGLQGEMPLIEDRPPLNLVFLIDTSGSMNDPSKLPLLVQSFRLMLDELNPDDQVAIVEYAGSAGVVLAPTPATDRAAITRALIGLGAGGSTNGQGGLEQAYTIAAEMTEDGEVSRVILATDGDFNVGISDPDALTDYISDQRETGIYLSVLGFGRGNLQDDTMQALAQNGNGTAAFIDTLNEAQRVLVDQLSGALYPIADDVKIQVEFNPAVIAEYRLIGYETRALAREDFNNDDVDAGELGAGHSVTAIYEVTPVGSPARLTDPLRYNAAETGEVPEDVAGELGFIRLRWKAPGAEESQLIDFAITDTDTSGTEVEFAAAIAGFGQLLRGSDFLGDWDYDDAIALANANRGEDAFGYRNEAVQLMRLAESLSQD
jgi:Ca-activated chloride channel homolog